MDIEFPANITRSQAQIIHQRQKNVSKFKILLMAIPAAIAIAAATKSLGFGAITGCLLVSPLGFRHMRQIKQAEWFIAGMPETVAVDAKASMAVNEKKQVSAKAK